MGLAKWCFGSVNRTILTGIGCAATAFILFVFLPFVLVVSAIVGAVFGANSPTKPTTANRTAPFPKESVPMAPVSTPSVAPQPQAKKIPSPKSTPVKLYAAKVDNIRSGPGTKFNVIRKTSEGELLISEKKDGTWYKLQDGVGEAWVHQSVVLTAAEKEKSDREKAEEEEKNGAKDRLDKYIKIVNDVQKETSIKFTESVEVRRVSKDGWQAIVTVSDAWHFMPYQIRLELAQSMWFAWAAIASPQELDKARISFVDHMDNEVGGSRIWAGSLIWVKE